MKGRELALAGLHAALTAVGGMVAVPLPGGVPFTMQTAFVLLAGSRLGPRLGALSQATYLALGAVGAPVFAGMGGGVGHLLGPTGGFLLGFPAAAWLTGWLVVRHPSPAGYRMAALAGLVPVYLLGAVRLAHFIPGEAISRGVIPFLLPDMLKALLAATVAYRLRRPPGAARTDCR
jgi:biotin transport system substrate-specific component